MAALLLGTTEMKKRRLLTRRCGSDFKERGFGGVGRRGIWTRLNLASADEVKGEDRQEAKKARAGSWAKLGADRLEIQGVLNSNGHLFAAYGEAEWMELEEGHGEKNQLSEMAVASAERNEDHHPELSGFGEAPDISSRGRAGGLAILWKEDQVVSLTSYSSHHIDVVVELEAQFRLTLFYGDPRAQNRGSSWDLIRRLAGLCDLPWIVMGDFNEVCYNWEATRVRQREESRMRAFRDVLEECGLFDLDCNGNSYTFSNKRMVEKRQE
ncbi:hypothetical protein QQ045_010712 [Rhodiola kirilowii]